MNPTIVSRMNDQAVRALVEAHARLPEPLVLAIRYKLNEPGIHLLEVVEGFPGDEDSEPFEVEFGASPEVRMVGALKLKMLNPRQLRNAIAHGTEFLEDVRADGRVEYYAGEGREFAQLLSLRSLATEGELEARRASLPGDLELSASDLETFRKEWL